MSSLSASLSRVEGFNYSSGTSRASGLLRRSSRASPGSTSATDLRSTRSPRTSSNKRNISPILLSLEADPFLFSRASRSSSDFSLIFARCSLVAPLASFVALLMRYSSAGSSSDITPFSARASTVSGVSSVMLMCSGRSRLCTGSACFSSAKALGSNTLRSSTGTVSCCSWRLS